MPLTTPRLAMPFMPALRRHRAGHAKPARDERVDFFRGLALLFIFIDHIPNNTWAYATFKNFGFADASEVFVLLAGYSAAIAYGAVDDRLTASQTLNRAGRRALEIYVWHIGILVCAAALMFAAAAFFSRPDYIDQMAFGDLASDPLRAIPSAFLLIYQPHYMNILPLYVMLMLWLPVVLMLMRRSVTLAMIVSFGIWALSNASSTNLPAQGSGAEWFFNPLAWQLLFTTGAAAAVLAHRYQSVLRTEVALLAGAYVVFALVVAAPWVPISFLPDGQLVARETLGSMSKHYLSVWRYLHILALAYLIAVLVPRHGAWLKTSLARMISRCGRHSMAVYALGTLLSLLGWIALTEFGSSLTSEWTVNLLGVAILSGTAWYLSRLRAERRKSRSDIAAPTVLQDSTAAPG